MREYRFAVATAAATFLLLVIGGLVHPTGSSLACPDWPLCNGMVFPPMQGGILYEHGHRLAALAVSVLTVALAVMVFRGRRERDLRWLSLGAVALVGVQASLGALTVIYRLPLVVSASHLATSMAFFSPGHLPGPPAAAHRSPSRRRCPAGWSAWPPPPSTPRSWSGRWCATPARRWPAAPTCCSARGRSGRPGGLPRSRSSHRLLGYMVAALVTAAALRTWRLAAGGPPLRRRLALLGPALAAAQVTLGLLTVASYVSLPIVALHLAFGAALLANQLALFFLLGPRGAAVPAPAAAAPPPASPRRPHHDPALTDRRPARRPAPPPRRWRSGASSSSSPSRASPAWCCSPPPAACGWRLGASTRRARCSPCSAPPRWWRPPTRSTATSSGRATGSCTGPATGRCRPAGSTRRWRWPSASAVPVFALPVLALVAGPLTAALALAALVSYVAIYTPLKRRSSLALFVGAVPGAIPPLMGWTAVTGHADLGGVAVFLLLLAWQLPHFIAISLYLKEDYARGGMKVFALVHGDRMARAWIAGTSLLLLPASLLPVALGLAGWVYGGVAVAASLAFTGYALTGLRLDGRVEPLGAAHLPGHPPLPGGADGGALRRGQPVNVVDAAGAAQRAAQRHRRPAALPRLAGHQARPPRGAPPLHDRGGLGLRRLPGSAT